MTGTNFSVLTAVLDKTVIYMPYYFPSASLDYGAGFPFFATVRSRKEMFLFNDALNTLFLRLYGVRHIVKDHSESERGNPLPPHGLLFPINRKGSFICIIPQTG